jgi:hypothetical protein
MGNELAIPNPLEIVYYSTKSIDSTDVYILNKSSYIIEMLDYAVHSGKLQYVLKEPIQPCKKYTKILQCEENFKGMLRYHFADNSKPIMKYYHFEITFNFKSLQSTENHLSVKSLFFDELFPITYDITHINHRYLVILRNIWKDVVEKEPIWTNIQLENNSGLYQIHDAICTAVYNEKYRLVPFHSNIQSHVSHVRLYSTWNNYAYISAVIHNRESLLCTNIDYDYGYWHDLQTNFMIKSVCMINDTIIVHSRNQILCKGKSFVNDEYYNNEFQVVRHYLLNDQVIIKVETSGSSVYVLTESGTLFRFTLDISIPITLDGVQDFVVGYRHIIVIVKNGLIWYNDRNGDFQPENSYEMTFKDPENIRFIINSEKASLLWTYDDQCFVIGNASNLIGVSVIRWCQVILPHELKNVKKIVSIRDHFYVLTENGELWKTSNNGFIKVNEYKVLTDDEQSLDIFIVDISCTRNNLFILFDQNVMNRVSHHMKEFEDVREKIQEYKVM